MFTPPDRARRIDRLARGAHRFHRFAHHPLCAPYAGEVIRAGRRTRLCRGCTYAAAGALLGASFVVAIPPLPVAIVPLLLVASALAGAGILRQPTPAGSALRRSPKLLTRALPAATLSAATLAGARAGDLRGGALSVLGVGLLAAALLAYRRRGPDRTACTRCPERQASACSGLRPIARREAAFARRAARILREIPERDRSTAATSPS